MGELRLPGLATGIDTATLINQMMAINSRRLAMYQVKKMGYERTNTALDELKAKVAALESATGALSDSSDLEIYSSSTSDSDMLTLSTSSQVNIGSHSIEINQLATTETWIQDVSTFDNETDYVGGGTFMYSYNNQERTIITVADSTTLADLVTKINKDNDNPGVTASLLNQGGKYHLMLSGQESGGDYRIYINSSSTEVLESDAALTLTSEGDQNAGLTTKITELFESGTLGGGEKIQIAGTDRFGNALNPAIFEFEITDKTTVEHLLDKIEDAFGGNVKATLEEGKIVVTDTTSGDSLLSITSLTYDNNGKSSVLTLPTMDVSVTGGTAGGIALLDSSSFVQTQAAQNSQIKVDDFTPSEMGSEVQTMTATVTPTESAETYTLTYMGQTTEAIASDATDAQIQSALELLSTVTVGDIDVSDTGDFGLADGVVTFTFDSSLGDVSSILIDDRGLVTPGAAGVIIAEEAKGNNGYTNRSTNNVSDALTGITLNLQDVTDPGEPIEITVSRNTGAVSKKVNSLVGAYNALVGAIDASTGYDSATKRMALLSRNMAVTFLKPQMRNFFQSAAEGFVDTIDSFVQASDIGLTFDGAGMMKFDNEIFNDAVNEDFTGVLELLGATASGNSTNSIIQFDSASETYTTAGTYEVKVDINGISEITDVWFKHESESTWRLGTYNSLTGRIAGDDTMDEDNGGPLYDENGLQLVIDMSQVDPNTTYTTTVNVQQGIVGALEDMLSEVLKSGGQFDVSKTVTDDRITAMERRIENEEKRLTRVETRLIAKYARLERILTEMNQQMAAISSMASPY